MLFVPPFSMLVALSGLGHDFAKQITHDLAPGQDVNHWLPTPDGDTVFYSVTEDEYVGGQWFRVSPDGSQDALALTDPLPTDREFYSVQVTPDESRLVYTADRDTAGQWEIYSVPTDGSKAVVKLNPPLTPTQDVYPGYFKLTPDGTSVVFRVGLSGGALYSAPVDGSAPAVLLTATTGFQLWQITPDSQRVVYGFGEIFSVALDGSEAPVQVSGTAAGETPGDFYLSPDGQRVVYIGHTFLAFDGEPNDVVYWIFSAPVNGSAEPVLLFSPVHWVGFGFPEPKIKISPDSRWVIQRSDHSSSPDKLYSAPIDGSSPAIRLSGASKDGGVGWDFRFAPDGRVVYTYSGGGALLGIYIVRPDGSTPAQRITPLTQYPAPLKVEVANGRAVFVGYAQDPVTSELRYEPYSVLLSGNAPPVKLSPTMVPGGDIVSGNTLNAPSFRISDDGEWVVYVADQDTDGVNELYSVPIDGRLRSRKLNRPLPGSSDISEYLNLVLGGSKRVIYVAWQDEPDTSEIFTTELGDPPPFLGGSSSIPAGRPIH